MTTISFDQKYAVLHCVFQIVYSTYGNVDEERDEAIIDYSLTQLGFTSIYAWDRAATLYPQDCFQHISQLNEADKQQVRHFLQAIPSMSSQPEISTQCVEAIIILAKL